MTPPTITDKGLAAANPINCQVYHRGDTIPFIYCFEDNQELGNFNIEVHNNFDHHTHSTEADDYDHDGSECEDHHEHNGGELIMWLYNNSFQIPAGQTHFVARQDIPVPKDIEPGLYHFMIRLTDKAGWQALKGIAIVVEE